MFSGIEAVDILLWFVVFIFSLSVHESAHAWMSDQFGDDTGKVLGRISLNPIVHIDPIGTIIFPLAAAIFSVPLFGWAKPVPVNPLAWREKDKANFWVSFAGPLSNFVLATIAFIALKVCFAMGIFMPTGSYFVMAHGVGILEPIAKLASLGLTINLALGIFNLLPVPPLDGSGMLESVLPYDAQRAYEQIKPYGFMLLFALLLLGVFSIVYFPVLAIVRMLLLA